MAKERLDVLLVSRGLAESREKAKAIIMSGNVYVDGQKEDKAGSNSCRSRDRGPRQYIKIRKPRWLKIRKSNGKFRCDTGGENLHGRRFFHGRIYGLYVTERCSQSLCG